MSKARKNAFRKASVFRTVAIKVLWAHALRAKCGGMATCILAIASMDVEGVAYAMVEFPENAPPRLILTIDGWKHRFPLSTHAMILACMNDHKKLQEDQFPQIVNLTSDGQPNKSRNPAQRKAETQAAKERKRIADLERILAGDPELPKKEAKPNPRHVMVGMSFGTPAAYVG